MLWPYSIVFNSNVIPILFIPQKQEKIWGLRRSSNPIHRNFGNKVIENSVHSRVAQCCEQFISREEWLKNEFFSSLRRSRNSYAFQPYSSMEDTTCRVPQNTESYTLLPSTCASVSVVLRDMHTLVALSLSDPGSQLSQQKPLQTCPGLHERWAYSYSRDSNYYLTAKQELYLCSIQTLVWWIFWEIFNEKSESDPGVSPLIPCRVGAVVHFV